MAASASGGEDIRLAVLARGFSRGADIWLIVSAGMGYLDGNFNRRGEVCLGGEY